MIVIPRQVCYNLTTYYGLACALQHKLHLCSECPLFSFRCSSSSGKTEQIKMYVCIRCTGQNYEISGKQPKEMQTFCAIKCQRRQSTLLNSNSQVVIVQQVVVKVCKTVAVQSRQGTRDVNYNS